MHKKVRVLIWLGVGVVVISFFGLTSNVKTIIFSLLGIVISVVAFTIERSLGDPDDGIKRPEKPYLDNSDEQPTKIAVKTENSHEEV